MDQGKCVDKDRVSVITDYDDVLAKQMARKMETTNGKLKFVKRIETVEWLFGNIKTKFKAHRISNTRINRKKPDKRSTQPKKSP
ncbi:MAG TPA: hypothetical protein GX531_04785 [Methanothermobacter sp.]|nr:hypothetical protein [Methanothermobacter sp.]